MTTPWIAAAVLALGASAAGAADVQRYDNREALLEAARERGIGALNFEDFEDNHARFLSGNEFASCTEPVDATSDDACFAPGGLTDGIRIRSHNRLGVIVPGLDIFDIDSYTIAAWPYQLSPTPLNYAQVHFEHRPTVVGVDVYGFKLENGSATGEPVPVVVEAFDVDDVLIESFTLQPAAYNVPTFVGFATDEPIAYLQIGTRVEVAGALLDNLSFGGGAGQAQLSMDRLEFGATGVADVAVRGVELRNEGALPLIVASVSAPAGPFTLQADDCSITMLAPDASCTLIFAFEPAYAGDFEQALSIDSNDPDGEVALTLRGTGVQGSNGQGGTQ